MSIKSNFISSLLVIVLVSLYGCGGGGGADNSDDFVIQPFQDQNAFEYFPIDSNATWVYSAENDASKDQSWWLEDAGNINGNQTYALTRDTGSKEYYVSNATGVYLAGLYLPSVPTTVGEFTANIKFDKLIPILTKEMIDESPAADRSYYTGGGKVDIKPNYGVNKLSFTASHQYIGDSSCESEECIDNFDTKRVYLNIDMTANVDGYSISLPLTFYAELAKGVGYTEFRQDYLTLYLSGLSGIEIQSGETSE